MKLVIKLDYNTYLAMPAENAGIVLKAFSEGTTVESDGYGSEIKYTPKQREPFEFSIVPDERFEATPAPLEAIQKAAKEAETRYYGEYTKRIAAEKERDDLKSKLESLKTATDTALGEK